MLTFVFVQIGHDDLTKHYQDEEIEEHAAEESVDSWLIEWVKLKVIIHSINAYSNLIPENQFHDEGKSAIEQQHD